MYQSVYIFLFSFMENAKQCLEALFKETNIVI
jgi:hypothetical protein